MTLGQLLHSAALEVPAKIAFFCEDQSISYEELDRSTTRLAGWFISQGLKPGDRVATHWPNRIEAVQLLFGAWKAGLIAVTINTRLKPPEVEYILGHSQARLCFSEPSLAQSGALGKLPDIEECDVALPVVEPDSPALILYTSGSTAHPKGVTHSHRSLIENGRLVASLNDSGGRMLIITQMMHVSGLYLTLSGIYFGKSAVLLPAFQPAAVLDAIEQFHCAFAFALPVMMQAIVEEQARQTRDLGSLKTLLAGGDSVPISLQERVQALIGVPLQEVYAMTESSALTLNPKKALRPGSLGVAVAGVEIRVVDFEGCDLLEGETGEVVVRSPGNCIGYWNDPQASETLLRDGWLHTGDLASRDRDGYFWFRGRKKELIVRSASKISPQEVEEALYQHPSVAEAGVVGMPDPVTGERVVAFVSVHGTNAAPSEKELIEFARQRLADYKTPERILFLGQLPKGPTGKVQRRALKERLLLEVGVVFPNA